MPTLDWNKWAAGWSAAFPKNQMWGGIRSGENDPKTGEPLYRFNDKPSVASMSPDLADVVAAHRFVAPAVVPADQAQDDENCFCGWSGHDHGDHLAEKIAEVSGDHNADDDRERDSKRVGVTEDDFKGQTKVVGSGPGGKDPVDSLPDYSDDGEERPVRRAQDVERAQRDALSESEAPEEKPKPRRAVKSVKAVEVKDEPKLDRDDDK